jgi:uncharacterized protein
VVTRSAFILLRSAAQGRILKRAPALLFLLALLGPALAQNFPALTGRVVDAANLLNAEQRAALEAKLKAHEDKSTDQLVVATVPSLGDTSVEDYANRLFRHWHLGQKEKNNGALLLVAPNERKVRIEVGYGLEGALTDALSGVIIRTAIAPRFKTGDFAGGINAGVDAVLSVLTGDADEWQRWAKVREDSQGELDWITIAITLVILFIIIRAFFRSGGGPGRYHRSRGGNWIVMPVPSGGGWGGGFSGGGGFGGGFSGGGGSSGGGGASGSW